MSARIVVQSLDRLLFMFRNNPIYFEVTPHLLLSKPSASLTQPVSRLEKPRLLLQFSSRYRAKKLCLPDKLGENHKLTYFNDAFKKFN